MRAIVGMVSGTSLRKTRLYNFRFGTAEGVPTEILSVAASDLLVTIRITFGGRAVTRP